ncbi:hypothetical protein MMC25_000406 [Agyrium rufum]|nr:hypothetical protein [Agyrium rufum]
MPTTSVGSVKFCSATWAAAITVNESNEIHTWGHGEKGELGRGQDVSFADLQGEPFKLSKDLGESVSIMSLASGVGHCIAVLSNGDVYGWGDGRKGQLGTPNERYYEPRKVLGIDFKVVRAVCGNEFTYLVGDPQSGCHVLLGSDKWKVRSQMPADCTGWKDVGATWGSIFILREDGAIISWGRDDMGQLAPDTEAEMMAIGSEHSLALNKEGHVFAWGWGEHGNCGPQGIQPATSSSIGYRGSYAIDQSSISGTVAGLGAGCATSFMWIKQ